MTSTNSYVEVCVKEPLTIEINYVMANQIMKTALSRVKREPATVL